MDVILPDNGPPTVLEINTIPGMTEAGLPEYAIDFWYGLFVPHGTPTPVIVKLNKTLNESLVDESVRQRMVAAGVVVKTSTPQVFGEFMAAEYKRWNAVREAAGISQQ